MPEMHDCRFPHISDALELLLDERGTSWPFTHIHLHHLFDQHAEV
jgi:hypothetical protein